MSNYNSFALFYDKLMEDAEYKVRSEFISNFFYLYNPKGKTVLDLACGTGNITKHLADRGYEITALDLSEEMLSLAMSKGISDTVFVKGDMRSFELPYKVDNCVCSLDAVNHLNTLNEVNECFKCVYNSLNDNGIFVFDVNTIYKHNVSLADKAFIYDEDDFFLAWDNTKLDNNQLQINLDFFIENDCGYERISEEFVETAYSTDELKDLLKKTGFEVIKITDDCNDADINEYTERAYFICKRK